MYDFINYGDFPDEERAPYRLIRWWLLDCYYSYCRGQLHYKNHGKNWDSEPIIHQLPYAYEQCEHMYHIPIEQLMIEVLTLTMWGGSAPVVIERRHREKIEAILAKHPLGEMLKPLQGEELGEFSHDLKLLGFM